MDVDAIGDGRGALVGIMEHIENAGIHSGDSACVLPPHTLREEYSLRSGHHPAIALGLKVVGLLNIQFAVKGSKVYVLEVNPRASRTVPFVSKATGVPVAKIAAQVMAGKKLKDFKLPEASDPVIRGQRVGTAVFPVFRRGYRLGSGDEIHRGGHGDRGRFRRGLFQVADFRESGVATEGRIFISVKEEDKRARFFCQKT